MLGYGALHKHLLQILTVYSCKPGTNVDAWYLTSANHQNEPIKSKWRVTHQSYTPFDSVLLCLYLCVSFDLLKVGILDVVILWSFLLAAGLLVVEGTLLLISTGLRTSLGTLIHLL